MHKRIASILLLSATLLTVPLVTGCGGGYGYTSVGVSSYTPTGHVAYVDVAPPPTRVEHYGEPPSRGHVWIGGRWVWGGGGYRWANGYWASRPYSHARWSPGRWNRYGTRWYWVDGRWR